MHRIISHLTVQHHLCTSSAPLTPAPGGITRAQKDDFIEDDGGYKSPKRVTLSKTAEGMIERECEHSGLDEEEEEEEEEEEDEEVVEVVEEPAPKYRKRPVPVVEESAPKYRKRPVPVFTMEEEEELQSPVAKRRRIQIDEEVEVEEDGEEIPAVVTITRVPAKKSGKSMKRPAPVSMEEARSFRRAMGEVETGGSAPVSMEEALEEESLQSSASKRRRRIQILDSDSECESDILEASTMKVGSKLPRVPMPMGSKFDKKKKAVTSVEGKKVVDRKRVQSTEVERKQMMTGESPSPPASPSYSVTAYAGGPVIGPLDAATTAILAPSPMIKKSLLRAALLEEPTPKYRKRPVPVVEEAPSPKKTSHEEEAGFDFMFSTMPEDFAEEGEEETTRAVSGVFTPPWASHKEHLHPVEGMLKSLCAASTQMKISR